MNEVKFSPTDCMSEEEIPIYLKELIDWDGETYPEGSEERDEGAEDMVPNSEYFPGAKGTSDLFGMKVGDVCAWLAQISLVNLGKAFCLFMFFGLLGSLLVQNWDRVLGALLCGFGTWLVYLLKRWSGAKAKSPKSLMMGTWKDSFLNWIFCQERRPVDRQLPSGLPYGFSVRRRSGSFGRSKGSNIVYRSTPERTDVNEIQVEVGPDEVVADRVYAKCKIFDCMELDLLCDLGAQASLISVATLNRLESMM